VWFLFVYFIWAGIRGVRGGATPWFVLLLLPGIFMGIQFWSLCHPWVTLNFFDYILALIAGSCVGWHLVCKMPIQIDIKAGTITAPGSWQLIIFLMLLFIIRWFFGFMSVAHPEYTAECRFWRPIFGGTISGILLGRSLYRTLLFWKAKLAA
jgi:hypothetical protein